MLRSSITCSALAVACIASLCPAQFRVQRASVEAQKAATTQATGFEERIDALSKSVGGLNPDEAARQWLALGDEQPKIAQQLMMAEQYENRLEFSKLMKALPAPAQWPALRKAIDQRVAAKPQDRRTAALSILVDVLLNDDTAGLAAIDRYRKLAKNSDVQSFGESAIDRVAQSMGTAKPEQQAAAFEAAVTAAEAELKKPANEGFDSGYLESLEVPDLVTLVGQEKAEALLKRAVLTKRRINLSIGDETAALARKVALQNVKEMPALQWQLCESVDAVPLYDAMVARAKELMPRPRANFVQRLLSASGGGGGGGGSSMPVRNPMDDFERRRATQYYLLGLIIAGRTDDAHTVAKQMATEQGGVAIDFENIDRSGFQEQLYAFLFKLAQEDPATPYWNTLVEVAVDTDHSKDVLDLIRQLSKKPELTAQQRDIVAGRLATALFAADEVDEGVRELEQSIKSESGDDAFRSAVQLATIGRVVGRPVWQKEGLDDAVAAYSKVSDTDPDISIFAREMEHAARQSELLKSMASHMAAQAAATAAAKKQRGYQFSQDSEAAVEIAAQYCKVGLPQESLNWIDQYTGWNAADLAQIQISSGGHGVPPPLAYWAALALAKTGHPEKAKPILDHVLSERGGLDDAYVLLLQIDPNPTTKLDELFSRDRFEERPLIWKAVLARKAGKLDEAEKLLRQAITIDPSDGEQGKGDRMRVYSVLAEVLADKGDAKNAEIFRNVVKTIRKSEDADDAYNAGLLTRAITMYKEALKSFSDAYCVQSRLAVQLSKLGRNDEAEVHYRRAFELMPDSFGRVESHCFGCERAFAGKRAESVAERTFKSMLVTNPQKPQLHYLLGYLRTEQNRYAEAKPEFAEAVRLDPDYLNAWNKLGESGGHVQLTPEEADNVVLNKLRLDPLSRHTSLYNENVHDLARFYAAAAAAVALRTPSPTALYPLKASADAMAKSNGEQNHISAMISGIQAQSAGEALAEVERVKAVLELFDSFSDD